jgi:hypothetical protein
MFGVAGFRPGRRGCCLARLDKRNLCVEQKAPKPVTPRLASWEGMDASLKRADQLAEPSLVLSKGHK